MVPTDFPESNAVLGKPPDMSIDECEPLNVWRGVLPSGIPAVISCWKVTREELEQIEKTGRVWIMVAGVNMPPIAPHGMNPFIKAEAR